VQGRIHRQGKAARGDKSILPEIAALERAQTFLDEGTPIYRAGMSADERDLLKASFLLTTKPILIVVNIGEDQLEEAAKLAGPFGEDALAVSVQLESRLPARSGGTVRVTGGLGLGDGVVPRVARAAYHLLGRRTFLTTGPDESRAWTFRAGAKAPECAGVIHSDLQRASSGPR